MDMRWSGRQKSFIKNIFGVGQEKESINVHEINV